MNIVAVLVTGVVLLISIPGWGMVASNTNRISLLDTEDRGVYLSFAPSIDMEVGNMTYTIQGPEDDGWKSELEWPLDNIIYMGGIISTRFLGIFQLNAGIWKSLNGDSGTMKDSDWFYSRGDDKAIYGEFDAEVNAIQFDINFRYDFLRRTNVALGAMLGYSYTKWEWKAGDGYQISPISRYNVGNVFGTGIIYEEVVQVPYLGAALSIIPDDSPFGINLYTLYSPIAECSDVDDHVERLKESTGETEGTFLSLGGDISWNFRDPWALTGTVNYTRYDLEGYQDQFFYGGEDIGTRFMGIDLTVEGSQFYLGFMISYEL
jgi:outer membrane protease